uniref:Uncharacterized protein n=1 Tax=Parascaris equorum TaxID=6256 RepID=A0A914RNG2_PAREQ
MVDNCMLGRSSSSTCSSAVSRRTRMAVFPRK